MGWHPTSTVPFTIPYLLTLQLRKPAHHLRWRGRAIHDAALMDANRRVNLGISSFQICLTCQESISINGAGGHPADALAVGIDHGVAVMRHTDALSYQLMEIWLNSYMFNNEPYKDDLVGKFAPCD